MTPFVLVERPRPTVALVTLNRPERMNSMSFDVMVPLRDALRELHEDNELRAVVLTGAGDRAFCAGADLGGMATGTDADPAETHAARGELAGLFTDLWALGKPTIARVRGYALAGGGPLLVGVLHDAEGEWTGTFVLLFATLVVFLVAGCVAARPRVVEDELRARSGG